MTSRDLGTRIKRARERHGWSQQELADAVGKGVRSVGRWERGETVPKSAIGALEDVLGEDFTSNGTRLVQPDMTDPAEALFWRMTRYSEAERREYIADLRARRRTAVASTG